jgi:hypothetical protein
VVNGVATLFEIETHWSIDDLEDATQAYDLQTAANYEAPGK